MLLTLAACAGRIATPEGWSGGALDGDTLYIGTRAGDVRAIDTRNGETLDRFILRGEESLRGVYGTPALHNGALYVGGYDSMLYALSTPDLVEQWQEPVGGPIVGAPTVADGVVLVGSDDYKIYAFDHQEESLRHRHNGVRCRAPKLSRRFLRPAFGEFAVGFLQEILRRMCMLLQQHKPSPIALCPSVSSLPRAL